jgi:hypothetical protein
MLIDDEEYEILSNPDLGKAENQDSCDKIIVNDLSNSYGNTSGSTESFQINQNPKDIVYKDSTVDAIDSKTGNIILYF